MELPSRIELPTSSYTKKILADPESMQKFVDDALSGKLDTTAGVAENRNILQQFYVVEAVPDTNRQELAVVTAYKKKATEQQTRDANSPHSDVRNASADVTFNIRDKGKEQYQYLIGFKEIKKKTTQVSHTVKNNLRQAFELSSDERISQKSDSVNTQDTKGRFCCVHPCVQ